MFFRKRKKKFTQINTFQDSSSGWDSGAIRPQRRFNKDEMYQITFEMMKKGSTNLRNGKDVRQFGVMVGTDLKLVTSGDFVDRETYEALLAVDAIDAPNRQMNIPGIVSDQPSPPPRPNVPEVMQHVNPVHHEVVGMASVRPMRRKAEETPSEPKRSSATQDARPGAQGAAPVREMPFHEKSSNSIQPHLKPGSDVVFKSPVRELPNESVLEALDVVVQPAPMPEDLEVQDSNLEDENLAFELEEPLDEVPECVANVQDAYDLPPMDMPEGIDMEDEIEIVYVIDEATDENHITEAPTLQAQDTPVDSLVLIQEQEIKEVPSQTASVQTELMELLGEKSAIPQKRKRGRGTTSKKKHGKR